MTDNAGKIQIVIKGGKPWGFQLKNHAENRSSVVIHKIELGGKADIHGGLKVGDHVIKINDVLCLSLEDAVQLIDSAFRTLTILIWRPSYCVEERTNFNNIEFKSISQSIPYPICNKIGSVFQKFHDFKHSMAISDKFILKSNKNKHNLIENDFSSSKLLSKTTDVCENKSVLGPCPRNYSLLKYRSDSCSDNSSNDIECLSPLSSRSSSDSHHSTNSQYTRGICSLKESRNSYKNDNFNDNLHNFKCFNSIPLTSSHQNSNLQYMCEQYPLSELFLNHKSDLKLESLASHSKRMLKGSYHKRELNLISQNNDSPKELSLHSNAAPSAIVPECLCCMYPKCHSSYSDCKMHSPPERDLAANQATISSYQSYSQYSDQKESVNTNSIQPTKSSMKFPSKSFVPNKYSLRIKEDGFKNADLKLYNPSFSNSYHGSDYYDHKKLRSPEVCTNEPMFKSQFKWHKEQIDSSNCPVLAKEQPIYANSMNESSHPKFSNEIIPEISVKSSTFVINHIEQNNAVNFENNAGMKEMFSLCNHQSNSDVFQANSFKQSYLEEKEQSIFVGSNNRTHLKISNEATIVNIFSTETSKSDGDEDEELCLIEENARNNCTASSASLMPLPTPPHNTITEIIPSNDPLPSPPSFSPVKDVIYENVDIAAKSEETIYANLEMLQIKCSVVNSATQTSAPPFKSNEPESQKSDPTFDKLKNGYMKKLLQSQIHDHLLFKKSNVQKCEEKYTIKRHAGSLPVTSAYFTFSEPKAKLLTRYGSNFQDKDIAVGDELKNTKEELVKSINKKLGILRLEQIALKEEVKQNEELGSCLAKKLAKLATPSECEKFRVNVDELEKITNLTLSLSGRLARAENALHILHVDASTEEKSVLEAKYIKLSQQYEEANNLKKNIDRRNFQVSIFLKKYFTEEEFADYDHFIKMKTKLLVDCKELDEKIKLGEEQLAALRNSVDIQAEK